MAGTRAWLNFAADRASGGTFSNYGPWLRDQKLAAHEVEIRDARKLPDPPSFAAEGFELHRLPVPDPDWHNRDWVAAVCGPLTEAKVREVTGAARACGFAQYAALIRDCGKQGPGLAVPADFVHIDQSPRSGPKFVGKYCDADVAARYPRVCIFNVWRALSPPPQDMPLALCDQRTIDPADWVLGTAVEPGREGGNDTLTAVPNPGQRWHWFPDMAADEIIVFKAWDSAPDGPIGCLHGAFRDPAAPPDAVPRVSAEMRFFCFFEE